MKCPKCQFENREGAKFCLNCGESLEVRCPECGKKLPLLSKFCDECGQRLEEVLEAEKEVAEAERKYVTALFSDLSGYTAMSEKLDPEELKEITTSIFSQISRVIDKYEGFVEKFVGDAVMALFGVPKAHEDDPIRAIRAAKEIHELVDSMRPEVEKTFGQSISMHTGINTGLVVTGKVDVGKGTHGAAGDTINLASRLSSLARPGEILVGPDTYRQAEGYYTFEAFEPTKVKGKAEPIQVHKVLSPKERPVTIHRLSGRRADLIGRKMEMAELKEAVENLREGKGGIFSICGDAGTGKSRLVEEFKATLDLREIQWLEGRAYAYSQNIPYFPLIDLLNKVFEIGEGDAPEKLRIRIESGIEHLLGTKEDVVPYVGSLYSLRYPEVEDVSPEFWRSRLQDVIQTILSALARRALTVFFLEDLHWADPSFVEFLRNALPEIRQPAIVICVYRPTLSLFTSHQLSGIGKFYKEIRLQDLSLSEAQDMVESLLKTETIPSDLKHFVQDKAEGNPFYLEELINSLIESETLIKDNGSWKSTRTFTESAISSTIHGLISGRLDRLEKETKRILQEASVIGRAFLYEILKRITELEAQCDICLSGLERLDLIRIRSLQPDLEYIFKHALTQEVVYNGLLRKERQEIHERIGRAMEQLFQDRLPEFYETLAFHFKKGQSVDKAVDYLTKAGEKSLKRYALEESHQYYKEGFELLTNKPEKTKGDEQLLIDLFLKWALVFYYRADFGGLNEILMGHRDLAESLDDRARLGMFYAWIGFSMYARERNDESYQYLCKALKIGEEIENSAIIGYACSWLTWTCGEMGLLDEAIIYGEKAQEIFKLTKHDHYLYFKPLGGMGQAYVFMGEVKKAFEAGKALLDYGQRYSNIRSLYMGHLFMGYSCFSSGDFVSATEYCQKAIQVSVDPIYSLGGQLLLGFCNAYGGRFQEVRNTAQETRTFCENFGIEVWLTPSNLLLGIVDIAEGHINQGFKRIEDAKKSFLKNNRKFFLAMCWYILGNIYLQIYQRANPINLSTMAKNIAFLAKNVPVAGKKAEVHLNKAIEAANEIGAKGIMGQAYLDLGLLHKAKKRNDKANECLSQAIQHFEQCEAEAYLKQAKKALASLK